MPLDLYSPCPCGSGKKFKWCCQPIHEQIGRAFEQDANGQHEAALKTLEEVTAAHPGNPEVWGRKAQLLYQMDKPEEAEAALQKAFEINPNYPFGYYLKGKFRQHEGEIAGALILFRRAAELYDPQARPLLAQLYGLVAECELKLNRPVAARAALEIARRCTPEDPEISQDLQTLFGDQSRFPLTARREYKFQPIAGTAPPARRAAWEAALAAAGTGKLTDAATAFAKLAAYEERDADACYNLALCRAWLGDNPAALEALDQYIGLESDEQKAAEAWALGEVLRCGQGMEDAADHVSHSAFVPLRNPQEFVQFLGELNKQRRLVGAQVDEANQILTGLILEKVQALTPELEAQKAPHLGASFMLVGELLRMWSVNQEGLDKIVEEVQQGLAQAIAGQVHRGRGPALYAEVLTEGVVFPVNAKDKEEVSRRIDQELGQYLEETWIHRPLKSLSQVPPVDAAGHPVLRKKLAGVLQFLAECAVVAAYPYNFDRLRRKLGLTAAGPAPAQATAAAADLSALSAAELATVPIDSLSDAQAEEAYQTALRLDARDLAGKLAAAVVKRPPRSERPDRFPYFSHLVQLALSQNDTTAALDYVNEGEKQDCEHNEGRHRTDYELRRAQVLVRRGEFDQAQDAFDRLIGRVPDNLDVRVRATETMLSAKQGSRARRFAEEGLGAARKQQKRDSEEHFQELLAAAKKQGG